jgi:hypothetical protein
VIELRVQAGVAAAAESLTVIKLIATRFAGDHELRIVVETPTLEGGERTLRLGPQWMYDGSPACVAALAEFGQVTFPVA